LVDRAGGDLLRYVLGPASVFQRLFDVLVLPGSFRALRNATRGHLSSFVCLRAGVCVPPRTWRETFAQSRFPGPWRGAAGSRPPHLPPGPSRGLPGPAPLPDPAPEPPSEPDPVPEPII